MSLSDVVSALNGAISSDGRIDLYAASANPALTALRPMLARFTIASSFVLTATRLTPATNSATLIGSGRWGLAGAPAPNIATITAQLDCVAVNATDVAFTLTLAIAQPGWTFGSTFAGLPPTMTAEGLTVKSAPSFLTNVRLDSAAFATRSDPAAKLTLTGSVPMAPFWTRWQALIGPWPLQLSGTVTAPAAFDGTPEFDLLAAAVAARLELKSPLLDLGGLYLRDLGFGLVCAPGPDPTHPATGALTVLNISGRIEVGGLVARLSCPILAAGRLWDFRVDFENGDLVEGMGQLAKLFGLPNLPTPPNFLPIPRFRFSSVDFFIEPGANLLDFTVAYVSVAIESSQPWTSPAPFITVDEVGISWLWGHTPIKGVDTGWLAATIYGTIKFGTNEAFHIDGAVQIPGWSVSADLREGDVIPISKAFRNFFGSGGPATPSDMNVVGLSIDADPQEQSYYAEADIIFGVVERPQLVQTADGKVEVVHTDPPKGWRIDLGITSITLQQLGFHVSVVGGEIAGGIGAMFLFGDDGGIGTPPTFMLSAEYPGPAESNPQGWTFAGRLKPGDSIKLRDLVRRFLGQSSVPTWVPDLRVDRLYFSVNTGTPKVYAFGGTISLRWQPTIFGTPLKISAAASLDLAKRAADTSPSGKLEGLFSINQLELTAGLTLGVPEPTYQFRVKFGDFWFQAFTSWRDDSAGGGRHQVITLQLGGITVGELLEYLVNLAAPTLGYSLDPPWDVLKRIELSRFTLTLDPQESVAELVYAAEADLVFMRLDTIGIRYRRGENSGVSLIITGELLGQRYDGDDLAWDVINDSPPSLPGQDETFLRLRYLGLGQRVRLTTLPDTVAETLKLLEGELKEITPDKNPLTGQNVQWSPDSQFLIGLDIGLIDTLDLGIVFNDPWLYGLSVALSGEKAGSLAGLKFEILYKKISDNVGMFRIELVLPEAFRTFEFGEVSVTLGVVVIEIYTNGNFKIDLGFPYNRSYERSFTIQVFPFIGRGGIYFGLLDGTTSRRVPRVTNGAFAPVIELGVGLAVGVGKEIHVGPLSGGIYVQVEVVFEGVLGFFNPSAVGGETSTYYWAQGVAAIHGKLYGTVDFAVIKVSVTLEAYAAATVTLEAYRPTVFRLQVSVSAEAEITILFVTISFSFEVGLDVSFEIGQEQPTPWILSADQSRAALRAPGARRRLNVASPTSRGAARRRLPGPARRPERRRAVLLDDHLVRLRLRATIAAAGAAADAPNWQPTKKVFADSPRTIQVYFLPAMTVGNVPLSWTSAPPVNSSPQYRFAMQLFAPTGASAQARTAEEAKVRSAALSADAADENDLDPLAATSLIQALLLYAIYAIPGGPQSPSGTVTAGQLAHLVGILDDPAAAGPGFTTEELGKLFDANVHLRISGMPSGIRSASAQGTMGVATPPFLDWTSDQTGPVNFATCNKVGPLYLWGVQKMAALFSPRGRPPPGPPDDPFAAYVSFAGHVFSDWCLLIAKAGVRDALKALDNRLLPAATGSQTLADLARGQPRASVAYAVRPGDTVETVADALGATVDELTFLNDELQTKLDATPAGGSIDIVLGVSPEVLAADNPGASLQKKSLLLGDLTIPVTATDTLNALAQRYGTTAAAILGVIGQETDTKLLAAGATFAAPTTPWTAAPTGFTTLRTAAVFYVRYAGIPASDTPDGPVAAWYAQALAEINATLLQTTPVDPQSQELPPGTALQIPTAYLNATPAGTGYTTVPGDTLVRIGAALDLEQNHAHDIGSSGWPAFRDGVTTIAGGYSIPTFAGVVIAPAETTAMLARRTVVNWVSNGANWAGLATWIGGATILAPLTLITVPNVTTDATTSYTLQSLATAYAVTLTDLGRRLANVAGLVAGQALTVRHLPADTVQSLVDIVSLRSLVGIAHEASRFLFSGQQIPVPVTDPVTKHVSASDTDTSPLFDQTRQQWTITVDPNNPGGIAFALTLKSQVSWITLFSSTVVEAGESRDALRRRVPGAFAPGVNRALEVGRALPAGAIIHTDPVDSLSYSVTNAQVLAQVPATGLAWPPYQGPAAIAIKSEAPVTYGLAQHVALQTAVALRVPGFDLAKNTLSIHPFPASLLARAAAKTGIDYAVYASVAGTDDATQLLSWTFGCQISFTVRRLVEAPGVYQLIGADWQQIRLLLALIGYLADRNTPAGSVGYVLLPPSTTAADPSGLAVVNGDAWLIKSNLSTETVPPGVAAAANDTPVYRAGLGDLKNFALLLWEGSTVGGTGYTFGVTGGISDGAFDASDQATLRLLVIAGEQQSALSKPPPPSGRALIVCNNVVLTVDQAIPDGATLFAEALNTSNPAEFIARALVPAGSTGFDLAFTRPTTTDAEDELRRKYSLVTATAAVTDKCPYKIPASGLPASPQAWDGASTPSWMRARARRMGAVRDVAPKAYWAYQTVLPVGRFGPASVAPDVTGLPSATDDPYRGLGAAATAPQVAFAIGVGDVLGNRSTSGNAKPLCVDVGYTDPLNGPTTWPAVNAGYGVAKVGGQVTLAITIAAKAQALMPAVDQRGDALQEAARRQAELYAAIYYQYVQPKLAATAETTLQTGSSLALTGTAALPWFAAGAYLTAAGAVQYGVVTPAAASLATIVSSYGIGWEALATVNASTSLTAIFGANVPLTVPAYAVMASGDSAESIAAVARPPGWPTPAASAILNADPNKNDLPLRLGATLKYTARAFAIAVPAPKLAAAAAAQSTSAGWLAADSEQDAILAADFAFTVDDVTVTVGHTPVPNTQTVVRTFAQAVAVFDALGIHVSSYQLGDMNADASNLLIASAQAHTAHYVVAGAATLATNPSGASTSDLIAKNTATPDLYDAGALIYLGAFGTGSPPTVTPTAADRLAGFAARYGCPPATLLGANASRGVIAGTTLVIPGAVKLPASTAIFVPYRLRATDTLAAVAAGFDLAASDKATALAQANQNMPGTVTQGLTFNITVGQTQVPVDTTGLTSFGAVLTFVQRTARAATMADVAAAFEVAGRLAKGGLLVCPPARLASVSKPSAVPSLYDVTPAAFGLANAGVIGLVQPGVTLSAPDSGIGSVTTATNDTLNSIVGRFNRLYVAANKPPTATVARVIGANPDALLFAAQARALLPPADVVLSSPLGTAGPYPFGAFALTVELVVRRPTALVLEGFKGSGVEVARAVIAAPATASADGSMTFDAFEKALIDALQNLRLATAKTPDSAADLWAVNFDANGVTSVEVSRTVSFGQAKLARMMALAPLYGALVSRLQVPIAPLVNGSLDPGHAVNHDYQGVDVEVWASRFLTDFDRLLGPAPAAAIDAIVQLRPQFVRLMTAKNLLQTAVPADLAGVFRTKPSQDAPDQRAVYDPNLQAGLAEARKGLGQALGVSLMAAWSTAAIAQYDATVNTIWTRNKPPGGAALYGQARPKDVARMAADANPPWRLAAGKVSLSDTAPFLTLPLSISDPAAQSHLPLDLGYAISHIEIDRVAETVAPGYTRSDWLTMRPVLTGQVVPSALKIDLGPTDVPIPLKAFPALPLIVSQTGQGDTTLPVTLHTASLWTFRLVYSHEHAAQDHVAVTVEFNLKPPVQGFAVIDPPDLFTGLAQYVAVADDLNGLLSGLTDPAKKIEQDKIANAVTTFADMANGIAGLWNTRQRNAPSRALGTDGWIANQSCPFSAAIAYKSGAPRRMQSYTLTRTAGAFGPTVDWPQVACQTPDGTWVTLDAQPPVNDSRTYTPPSGTELVLTSWPHLALSWPGLNVGTIQNGRVKLQVVRNIDLLGASGPATDERFVYRTAIVTATDIVTPAITRTAPLAMTGTSVENALQAAFDALFPPASRRTDLRLTFELFYGYTLVGGPQALVSELAVGLIVDQTLGSGTAALVAGALTDWKRRVEPNPTGGLWVVSLMLYSSVDPGQRVLLSIDRLTYALS